MNVAADEDEERKSETENARPSGRERHLTIIDGHVDSRDLFIGTRDIVIVHGRDAYRLRLTAQNKLILTK